MKARRGGTGRLRGQRDERSCRLTINIDAATKAALEREAARTGSTVSRAAAGALRRALLGTRKGGSSYD